MRKFSYILVSSICSIACSSNGGGKPSTNAKKGPKQPKMLTQKPPAATAAGMGSSVKPPAGAGASTAALKVPGGSPVALFAWQTAIDSSGQQADCVGGFATDGSAAVACGPLVDTCDDGSPLEAGLLVFFDGTQNLGAFALVGSDLCGLGFDVIGCAFDGSGAIGDCGVGTIVDDHIEISAN